MILNLCSLISSFISFRMFLSLNLKVKSVLQLKNIGISYILDSIGSNRES